jgi:magnesium-transporting ATPase (P-type)
MTPKISTASKQNANQPTFEDPMAQGSGFFSCFTQRGELFFIFFLNLAVSLMILVKGIPFSRSEDQFLSQSGVAMMVVAVLSMLITTYGWRKAGVKQVSHYAKFLKLYSVFQILQLLAIYVVEPFWVVVPYLFWMSFSLFIAHKYKRTLLLEAAQNEFPV